MAASVCFTASIYFTLRKLIPIACYVLEMRSCELDLRDEFHLAQRDRHLTDYLQASCYVISVESNDSTSIMLFESSGNATLPDSDTFMSMQAGHV